MHITLAIIFVAMSALFLYGLTNVICIWVTAIGEAILAASPRADSRLHVPADRDYFPNIVLTIISFTYIMGYLFIA